MLEEYQTTPSFDKLEKDHFLWAAAMSSLLQCVNTAGFKHHSPRHLQRPGKILT